MGVGVALQGSVSSVIQVVLPCLVSSPIATVSLHGFQKSASRNSCVI